MNRLAFRLPDFTRISWVSDEAKAHWEPKIRGASRLVSSLELLSVTHGLRKCALVPVDVTKLPAHKDEIERLGLTTLELYRFGTNGAYSSEVNNDYSNYQVAMCAVGDELAVQSAYLLNEEGDSVKLGSLLGYPDCCTRFFKRVWHEEKYIDSTWPMAIQSENLTTEVGNKISGIVRPENNIFLRALGIRPVFHLPCSCCCIGTFQIATKLLALADSVGQSEHAHQLYEALSLPISWSALHGIAEIETPVFRASTKTDSTGERYSIQLLSSASHQFAAARGFRFPYARPTDRSGKVRYIKQTDVVIPKNANREVLDVSALYFQDNGFPTKYLMDRSQEPIVQELLSRKFRSVLYLGCRNAAMLRTAMTRNPSLRAFGVDPDPQKIERAQCLFSDGNINLVAHDIFDPRTLQLISDVEVVIVMIGRLLEGTHESALAIVERAKRLHVSLICYAYIDWLRKHDFMETAARLGIGFSDSGVLRTRYVTVGVAEYR